MREASSNWVTITDVQPPDHPTAINASQAVLPHLAYLLRRSEPPSGLAVLVSYVDAAGGVEALVNVGHGLPRMAQIPQQLGVHDGLTDDARPVPGPLGSSAPGRSPSSSHRAPTRAKLESSTVPTPTR